MLIRCDRANLGRLIVGVLSLAMCATTARAERQVVNFNADWRFRQASTPGGSERDFDYSAWPVVSTPHVFTPVGTPQRQDIYHGEAWYRKQFDASPAWRGQRVFLRFDAVAMTADVFLNGQRLGEHRGAFAAFTYEITDKIDYARPNQLAVRVDDRWNNEVSPLETSLLYGGIYRPVSLIVTGPVDITPLDYSGPGVYLTQRHVDAGHATVDVKTALDNGTDRPRPLRVRATLLDAGAKPLSTAEADTQAKAGGSAVSQTIQIDHPHLWNGVDDPYLYTVRVELLDGGKVVDSITQPLGLRFFRMDAKDGFFLNGKKSFIHGACLHQDWGTSGWAVTPDQEKIDLRIMRDMGANALRLVHYQHSGSALDQYDRSGMIVWAELAQFRLVNGLPAYRENVRQQLTEMIRQQYNHPSILMWSLYNELASKVNADAEPIVKDLNALAHAQDPSRPTIAAGSGDTIWNSRPITKTPDLIGANNYAGWYAQAPEDMNGEIERINRLYGNVGFCLSEYGGGAKIGDHKQNLKAGDVKPRGPFQPEEWQASVHEGNYRAVVAHPAVWGSFLWLAFDTGGLAQPDGTIEGGNIKGLVTQDRKTCKDAYYFYQANWATKPMLYLTSRRDTKRSEAVTPVKVYSNQPSVTLTVNGKDYGPQAPDDLHTFRWVGVTLQPGRNVIDVASPGGLKDQAVWFLATQAN